MFPHSARRRLALSLTLTACLAINSARAAAASSAPRTESLALNDRGYFEMTGLNVMLGSDYYPEGHQGGVGIIQNGLRTATNGDLRLEPTPGQWQAVPKTGPRTVDREHQEIRVHLEYPDETKNRKGFNPIDYPDLNLGYTVRVRPEGAAFRITVDLDAPLPAAWVGRVGFNLELFPGLLFGKTYALGAQSGIFPRQPNGPGARDASSNTYQLAPLAAGGRRLVIAPESAEQRLTIEAVRGGDLQLLDGRGEHNNGWFVVRSTVSGSVAPDALEWLVSPHPIPGWRYRPVVQTSQVGYHPKQPKIAVVELDAHDAPAGQVSLQRVSPAGVYEPVLEKPATAWGEFLRYRYVQFDFSDVTQPGMYVVRYGDSDSSPFAISPSVYQRDVWQPTLETFLPVQMCHMRVNDRYRVWHGFCHLDDALMAPVNYNHFDGYFQGPSTLTKFQPGEHVPGLDRGGWHDAGDYDLRIESQADTVHGLALAYEAFHADYDDTTVDQEHRIVELHRPDGRPDMLQQIEHGLLSIVGGYRSMGRLYRGIQAATIPQYTMLGDAANQTDDAVFRAEPGQMPPAVGQPGSRDDNLVFTEESPLHELGTAAALAAAARVLKTYNPALAADCRRIAEELWASAKPPAPLLRVDAATELLLTTGDARYADFLVQQTDALAKNFARTGWIVGRTLPLIKDVHYREALTAAARAHRAKLDELGRETPYGLPYRPDIWGAGWLIQRFGVEQYFLHTGYGDIFPASYVFSALNFVLGCHPGSNPASFVSGVGAKSMTTAYGFNRADASYIPGGVASGTALIRPDFPELLDWPYLWQQGEYCLGYPTSDYIFLVLAADSLTNR